MVRQQHRVVGTETSAVDLRDVRAFCRVVDLGSITLAAHSLAETKGSVSRRVARLERALGSALLRRTGRRVEPTEEGAAYREQAGGALDQLDEAALELRQRDGAPSGHLRVTAPIGFGGRLLGPILGPFVRAFPDLTVDVLLTDEVLSFRDHRIDVALRISRGLPDSSLVATRLFDLEGTLAASPAYLAEHGEPTSPEDLAAHRVLTIPRPSGFAFALTRGAESREITLRGHVTSHDADLLREAAIGGAGITLLPAAHADPDLTGGALVRVLPEWHLASSTRMWLLHPGGRVAAKVRAFRDFVVDHVRSGAACR